MKKIVLSIAMLALTASFGFSQGTVSFGNNLAFKTLAVTAANGHTDRLVYDTDNVTPLLSNKWAAQLYYKAGAGQTEGSLATIPLDTPARFRNEGTSVPGTWNPTSATKTFSDVAIGQTATLQVRVWDANTFSTYEAAVAGSGTIGKSVTFNYTVPPGGSAPADYYMDGLQSFTLVPVPEPTTIAFGLMGLGALLLRRRK